MIYERFKGEVCKEELIREGEVAICALSGGADSVALLFLLLRLSGEMGFSLRAVHVHHGIRGEEADRDASFTEKLCNRLGVPLEVFRVDAPGYAREKGLGLEEAGRILRRKALEGVRESVPYGKGIICLAHHMEDQAETVIHHLCRGSGLRGLSGISPRQEGYVHPLLCFHKEELISYLKELGEDFVFDSTNTEQEMTRNRIRLQVLPLLEGEVNKASVTHLCSAARIVRQADQYLSRISEERLGELLLPAPSGREGILLSQEAGREEEILQAYLVKGCIARLGKERDVSLVHVEGCLSLLSKAEGKRLSLGGGTICERRREGLFFYRQELPGDLKGKGRSAEGRSAEGSRAEGEEERGQEIEGSLCSSGSPGNVLSGSRPLLGGAPFPSPAFLPQTACGDSSWSQPLLVPRLGEACFQETPWGRVSILLRPYGGGEIVEKKYTKWFDYDKIHSDIYIRIRREGDYLLLGPQRRKLLRRFLIDEKIPREARDQVPLLCCGQQVLWVIPYRMGEGARLDSQTETVLEVSWLDGGYIDE